MDVALRELQNMWDDLNKETLDQIVQKLTESQRNLIIGLGAGRMGYSLKAFIMRLSHIGYLTYMLNDTSLPRVDSDTVVLINSSSGETPTMKLYIDQCRNAGCFIISFSADANSYIASNSNLVLNIPTIKTKQIMKTVFEQFSYILFDHIASEIIKSSKAEIAAIEKNHSILE